VCDCHVHVVGDHRRFPMAPDRVGTPPAASADELPALQRRLRLDRAAIVQPRFFGLDNAAALEGLRQLGPRRARGVAVIDDKTSPRALDDMDKAGIRGIRLNPETAGEFDPAASDVDHFGGAPAALGPQQPGVEALLALVGSGTAYVKISGAYRVSRPAPHYPDAVPLARALIAANPERILCGTDWPNTDSARQLGRPATDVSPFQPIDDGLLLNQLPSWAPERAIRQQILVDNPARLYGF
jgi:predicted TIM-barrel fold metal-dependent hydrolase